ncbi:MAG: hypothetical protein K2X50_03125 [Gammaproteobacteria bacterium]|nr:hypothetical protein [Gammaproteobacteria bacterium]
MMPRLREVKLLEQCIVEVVFDNDIVKKVNFADLIDFQVLNEKHCPDSFSKLKFDNDKNIIYWENGQTITIDSLIRKIHEDDQRLFHLEQRLLQPSPDTLLYKIVKFDYFIDMCQKQYLFFKNVTQYEGNPKDSQMPKRERLLREAVRFENNPDVSLYDFDEPNRNNTYACCFSLNESRYIWKAYAADLKRDLCLVFHYDNLKKYFIENYNISHFIGGSKLNTNNFLINICKVQYVDEQSTLTNTYHKNLCEYACYQYNKHLPDDEVRLFLSPNLSNFKKEPETNIKLSVDWKELMEYGAFVGIKNFESSRIEN